MHILIIAIFNPWSATPDETVVEPQDPYYTCFEGCSRKFGTQRVRDNYHGDKYRHCRRCKTRFPIAAELQRYRLETNYLLLCRVLYDFQIRQSLFLLFEREVLGLGIYSMFGLRNSIYGSRRVEDVLLRLLCLVFEC